MPIIPSALPAAFLSACRSLAQRLAPALLLAPALISGTPAHGASTDDAAPLRYRNCGQEWQLPHPPQRIIALNQHAADLMLALDGKDRLIGVSWLDDDAEAAASGLYQGVPVIARRYPSLEAVLAHESDFLVAGFATAFMPGRGPGTRDALSAERIGSYLVEEACDPMQRTADVFGDVLHDLRTMGRLLGAEQRAQTLADRFSSQIAAARGQPLPRPVNVLVFDSDLRAPIVEGGRGFVTAMLSLSGARNVFDDLDLSRGNVSWEQVVAHSPDVIVLIDANWSSAADKRSFLLHDPILSALPAVRDGRFIELRFTAAVPGIKSGEVLERLTRELHAVAAKLPPAVQ
ncbi:ABC transporter substrate-binding protein [Thauera butanivorans]|uniref:ABC transporter substrate-binding protein n=1 Tax=Thauera butanivorans TaxID=86174 RepID=UPI0008397DDF|nr:ABC transporter substrate-binding protein [Thauera butanivorans]